ncbi:MAG TPA: ABC transporter ATP-binding protein [Spirochaetota bacterium]|nr:ABC transporter ATP-binding protein [Spirochaetota bacterium]HPR48997.1 ABC transporter ATP-binding protein [Spirochaetota bacterium]
MNFSVKTGSSLAVVGPNGSGKSTLLQILAGIQRPSLGAVLFTADGLTIPDHEKNESIGFISPLFLPYRELSGRENLEFAARDKAGLARSCELLDMLGLDRHKDKQVKSYSTGMIQRLKYCIALCGDPFFLFLDEPGSNLDDDGREAMYRHLVSIKNERVLVIATNDQNEAALCSRELLLGS